MIVGVQPHDVVFMTCWGRRCLHEHFWSYPAAVCHPDVARDAAGNCLGEQDCHCWLQS